MGTRAAQILLGLTLVVAFGCAKAGPPEGPNQQIDNRSPAMVGLSVDYHKLADLALDRGDRADAKHQMTELIQMTETHTVATPESWDVRFDAATRLARLHIEDSELEAAEAAARRGLRDEARAPATLFRGYLHQTLGEVLEKRGELRGSVDEHTEAIKIFTSILEANDPGARAPGNP